MVTRLSRWTKDSVQLGRISINAVQYGLAAPCRQCREHGGVAASTQESRQEATGQEAPSECAPQAETQAETQAEAETEAETKAETEAAGG